MLAFAAIDAGAQQVIVLRTHTPTFLDGGRAGTLVEDFDGDGRDEVALSGHQRWNSSTFTGNDPRSGFIAFMDWSQESGYAIARTLVVADTELAGLSWSESSLFAVSNEGAVAGFSGPRLTNRVDRSLGRPVADGEIIDINGDDLLDVVVVDNQEGLATYDLDTGSLLWAKPSILAESLSVGQLDSDPSLEIIVSGGHVIDGGSAEQEWAFGGTLGDHQAVGRIIAGGRMGFAAARQRGAFTVFQTEPYSPVWSQDRPDTAALAIFDLDADGVDELLHATRGSEIVGYDVASMDPVASLWLGRPGTGQLAFGDFNGDGEWQLLASYGLYSTGTDGIQVLSRSSELLWQTDEENGPFSRVGVGDLDTDGDLEFVWMSEETRSRLGGGILRIHDVNTGDEVFATGFSHQARLHDLLLMQWDEDPALEIVVSIEDSARTMVVIDGSSGAMELESSDTGAGEILEQSGDGEWIVSLSRGINVTLWRSRDLAKQWTYRLDAPFTATVNDLRLLQIDADPAEEALIATSNRLIAFDLEVPSVLWEIDVPTASVDVATAAEGPILVALSPSGDLRRIGFDGASLTPPISVASRGVGVTTLNDDLLVICADGRINIFDLASEQIVAKSVRVGALPCFRHHPQIVSSGPERFRLWTGSVVGAIEIAIDLGILFSNGFEEQSFWQP